MAKDKEKKPKFKVGQRVDWYGTMTTVSEVIKRPYGFDYRLKGPGFTVTEASLKEAK